MRLPQDIEQLPENKEKIKKIIYTDTDLRGPHLFRYYNPKPSRVEAAEKAMQELIGTKYCLAVNSCTSALVASYRALGIGAGDRVLIKFCTLILIKTNFCISLI
ncbi:MAG: hypothetical protein DDT31_00416 [Syntrophomonadaceae bacterium]|nr:hypothetical protein [Bacillota bacterium]